MPLKNVFKIAIMADLLLVNLVFDIHSYRGDKTLEYFFGFLFSFSFFILLSSYLSKKRV